MTFGSPYDEAKYLQTIEACCLAPDVARLEGGTLFSSLLYPLIYPPTYPSTYLPTYLPTHPSLL